VDILEHLQSGDKSLFEFFEMLETEQSFSTRTMGSIIFIKSFFFIFRCTLGVLRLSVGFEAPAY
jgi:hypothetical protein